MRNTGSFLLAIVGVAAAFPAQAQDKGFTGAHVEAVVGWDNFSAGSRQSDSKDSLVFGGAVGYDYDLNGLVIGAEAELTGSGVSASTLTDTLPPNNVRIEADRDIYIGAKLGYAFSKKFMAYGKVGYSNLRVETNVEPTGPGGSTIATAGDSDGFSAGAGLEYRVSRQFYVKGEYRYSHYGDVDDFDTDIDRNQIILGVGLRF